MRGLRAAAGFVILSIVPGCEFSFSLTFGDVDDTPPAVSASLRSDGATDGHAREDGAVFTGGVVQAGFDPAEPAPRPERRGFLSFPIDSIPVGALVESADLSLTVDRVDLLPGSADLALDFDRLRYGSALSFSAFSMPGFPVASVASGIRLFPSGGPQTVTFPVVPDLQADVDDPSASFFQVRVIGTGGLARIVDGAGNRAPGLPPDPSLAPVLSVRYR